MHSCSHDNWYTPHHEGWVFLRTVVIDNIDTFSFDSRQRVVVVWESLS